MSGIVCWFCWACGWTRPSMHPLILNFSSTYLADVYCVYPVAGIAYLIYDAENNRTLSSLKRGRLT